MAEYEHVAIVGAGFSGSLLAINLLRHDGPRATLIERRVHTARGVAYSTATPEHVLNVRAANMSALPDDPAHFSRWLDRAGRHTASAFVPRQIYGDYLDALLAETVTRNPGRLAVVHGDATGLDLSGGGVTVALSDGGRITADAAALALGNLPPLVPRGLAVEGLPEGVYVTDPWSGEFATGLGDGDTVLVLGTGLTMIDVALLLDARGFRGRTVALSRRGLLPHAHGEGAPATPRGERPTPTSLALLRDVRGRAGEIGWRAAVDELRPFTQDLWGAMTIDERRRFLRHLRPWWDVHRHRIAPQVAARIARMRDEGRLVLAAGTLLDCAPQGDGGALRYRPRGSDAIVTIAAARIVNGTGPQGDITRTREPLLRALHGDGLLRPDPLCIGVDVDRQSRVIHADGMVSDRLHVLGPMTRGAFWEIVAVPDIRRQAWAIARRLANRHWVEGEGL